MFSSGATEITKTTDKKREDERSQMKSDINKIKMYVCGERSSYV